MWKNEEVNKSSTWREMKAIFIILQSLSLCLSNKLVKIYTDNQNVARICNVWSMKPDLQYLALQIYELCIRYSIIIELEWIPRDLNVQADFYSKIFDFDDGSVAPHMFCFFNQKWGPFSIDRFANSNNHQLDNFSSLSLSLSLKLAAMANIHTMDQYLSPLRCFLITTIVKLQYNAQ